MKENKMNKDLKNKVLKKWIIIDKVIFEDNDPKSMLTKEDYQEYVKDKSAFLVNLKELYNLMKFEDSDVTYENKEEMEEDIRNRISVVNEAVNNFMVKDNIVEDVKHEIVKYIKSNPELNKLDVARSIVQKYHKNSVIDHIFLNESFLLGKNNKHWKFKLLFNTHKVMRENLINYASKKV